MNNRTYNLSMIDERGSHNFDDMQLVQMFTTSHIAQTRMVLDEKS